MLTKKGRQEFHRRLREDPQKFVQAMKRGNNVGTTLLAISINEMVADIATENSTNPEKDVDFIEAVKWYVKERLAFLDSKKQEFGSLTTEEEFERTTALDDINDDINNIEKSGKLKFNKQVEMINVNQEKKDDPAHYVNQALGIRNMMRDFLREPVNGRHKISAQQALQDVNKRTSELIDKQNNDYLDQNDLKEYDYLRESKRLIIEYLQPSSQKSIKQDAQHLKSKSNVLEDKFVQQETDSAANKSFSPTANIEGIRRAYAEFYISQKCLYAEPFDDPLLNEYVYNAPLNINAKGLNDDDREVYDDLVRESYDYADQYAQKFMKDVQEIKSYIEENIVREKMDALSEKQFLKGYVKEFQLMFKDKGYSRKFDKHDIQQIEAMARKFYQENDSIIEDDDVLDEIMETAGGNLGELEQKPRKEILRDYLKQDTAKMAARGSAIAAIVSEFEQQVGQLEKLRKSDKKYRPLQEKAFSNHAELQQLYDQSDDNSQLLGNYSREDLGKDMQRIGIPFHEMGGTIEAKVNQLVQELQELKELSSLKSKGKSNSKLEGKAFAHMAELQHLYRIHMLQQQSDDPQSVLGNYDPILLEENLIKIDGNFIQFSNNTKWRERNNHDLVDISNILLEGDKPEDMAAKVMERMRQYAEKVKKDYDPWLSKYGKYGKYLTKAQREDIREQRNREFNIGRKEMVQQLAENGHMEAFSLVEDEFHEYRLKATNRIGKSGFRGLCRDSRNSDKSNPIENDASREVSKYVQSVKNRTQDASIKDNLFVTDGVCQGIAMADANSMVQYGTE
ncbi:MAG: hypothetical protein GY821_03595 [Gammaproteobacteria bacterium]|nr:hypothetical protein [Gammaproteobacteria bacterium]